ncbi:inositol monophosphatase family protein [Aeromicrobium sp. CTD01-1L150]|uniref:inositol monophosphatase family protein n=1 Tax=Aeromicrobium sp. CTD01-1L150 TaxID=3341830 RepID=UPI0035C175B8
MSLPADAQLALDLVRDAAGLAARMRDEPGLAVSRKTSVSDIVTAADHAAEELIVGRLTSERPADGLLGEEGTRRDGTSGRRWVIDPVDGTYNFASGSDYWCSAVALVQDGADGTEVLLGAVAHHTSGSVMVGGPDLPTTLDGAPVGPVHDEPMEQISLATYLHPGAVEDPSIAPALLRVARRPATLRMLGSGSMDLRGVARGRLGGWVQHTTPEWDWWPGCALVLGAGGSVRQVQAHGRTWSVAGGRRVVESIVQEIGS